MTKGGAYKMNGRRRLLLVTVAMSLAVPGLSGQLNAAQAAPMVQSDAQAPKLPVYDIASIKLNKSGSGSVSVRANVDSYSATNISLKKLLQNAYGIREDLISGVPGPIDSARFDVLAKIVEPDLEAVRRLSDKQRGAMLLPVLIDRFQLTTHVETKTLPVYELVAVQSGPKLTPAAGEGKGRSLSVSNTELTARGLPMSAFVNMLEGQLHRTVIDKTGLADNYDFALKWSREEEPGTEADSSAPSIFTALQEQLGLKLQPAKGPVETLVIDHVAMPSEN
jgi:uncharacterized protein (TIGR03435 family)